MNNQEVQQLKQLAEMGLTTVYKKKDFYVSTYNSFIRNPKYTINQKMAFQCLQSYSGVVGSCYPSKETIAKDLNIGVKTAYRILKELEELGAIIIVNQITETNRKTSNLYILCDIDTSTGEFIPESIEQFKELTKEPIRIKGK